MAVSVRKKSRIVTGNGLSGKIAEEARQIASRKLEYVQICVEKDITGAKTNGFEMYEFAHQALPEIDLREVDPSVVAFGKGFAAPFFIAALTGGAPGTETINRNLAAAAQEVGIGMGLGSQRAMLKDPNLGYTYQVRDVAPDVFLLGNLGAAQLASVDTDEIVGMVRDVGADGLAIHLNPVQEVCQREGDTDWRHILGHIERICRGTPFPVVVKETGYGLNGDIARTLESKGVSGLDVAGAGGSAMNRVELYRGSRSARLFHDWGIQTATSLRQCREAVGLPLIASGGIRTGLDCAKALAMGASLVGFAWPLLEPALRSSRAVIQKLLDMKKELVQTMFLVGARNVADLRNARIYRRSDREVPPPFTA